MIKSQKVTFLKLFWGLIVVGLLAHPAFTQTVSHTPSRPTVKKASQATPKPDISSIKWSMEVGPQTNLKLLTPNKQVFYVDNQFVMAVIESGKISVYQYTDQNQWTQVQTIEIPKIAFTTLVVKDINNDQIPEIIGGTTEPGYIYIYYRDQTGQWSTKNDVKYIWSQVAKMTVAHFAGNPGSVLVVQNKEGFLFVLKPSETALNLIWKSPKASRPFESITAFDVDSDGYDELVATYKSGGVAILRSNKNALKFAWEYFPWGKILSVNCHDWDNNKIPELILPTTQKLVCVIRSKNKNFHAEQEASAYVIERIFFGTFQNHKMMFTTDASGKTHIAEYSAKSTRHWKEMQIFQTGRILDIFRNGSDEIILINQGLQLIKLKIETSISNSGLPPTALPTHSMQPTQSANPKSN